MEWLKRLVIKYLNDAVNNPQNKDSEEIEAMADSFVKEVERTISARKDFRYADNQR
ncbi:MAG: hypothetical protein IIV94_09725 [Clostridiales bacterium]|nr:hypothetical protein [Clostridiales bacterium]